MTYGNVAHKSMKKKHLKVDPFEWLKNYIKKTVHKIIRFATPCVSLSSVLPSCFLFFNIPLLNKIENQKKTHELRFWKKRNEEPSGGISWWQLFHNWYLQTYEWKISLIPSFSDLCLYDPLKPVPFLSYLE